jgi:hypothetical protein
MMGSLGMVHREGGEKRKAVLSYHEANAFQILVCYLL